MTKVNLSPFSENTTALAFCANDERADTVIRTKVKICFMVMILAVKINLYASIGEGCAKKI
jgi:hypothetical protein